MEFTDRSNGGGEILFAPFTRNIEYVRFLLSGTEEDIFKYFKLDNIDYQHEMTC